MVFIKDKHSFNTKSQCVVLSLDPLVYDATEDTTSNIVVPIGDISVDDIDNFMIFDDCPNNIWVIKGTSEQETELSVTLEPVWRIFSRDHIWNSSDYTEAQLASKGAFIATIIKNEYIDQTDSFYAYPYMTITNHDLGESASLFKAPSDEDGDIFSLSEYIENAVKMDDIGFTVTFTRTSLHIDIVKRFGDTHTVIFNDGHTLYEGSSFGDGNVGKVTVLQNGTTTDYYLNSNNVPVLIPPNPRVEGEWKLISVGDDEDEDAVQAAVDEEFKDTINSYKIEWASDRVFHVGDNIRFQLTDGTAHSGRVTYESKKSSDGLYHYKSGSLKTTLTDKVRSVK